MGNIRELALIFCIFNLFILNIHGVNQKDTENDKTQNRAYITYCDFNSNERPFCDWMQNYKGIDQGDWIRAKSRTPTENTGPSGDYPDGNGYFLYQEASNLVPNDMVRLDSAILTITGDVCVDFWYHMYGSELNNKLSILVADETGQTVYWQRIGNQGDFWQYGSFTIHTTEAKNIQISFDAVRGLTEYGDTAIDNIGVRPGPCGGTCSGYGDPHYFTFDNYPHTFMGNCTYTLTKLCEQNSTLTYFNVEVVHEYRGGNTHVSYVKQVIVYVHNYTISLEKNRVVKVNGQVQLLPVNLSPGVSVSLSGQYVTATVGFGLRVKYDGDHRVEVTLSKLYQGKVCGICANFNGDRRDDNLNPAGQKEDDSISYGNSWQLPGGASCSQDSDDSIQCTDEEKREIESHESCGIMLPFNGVFQYCHLIVDPREYFINCYYDMCALRLDPQTLCNNIQAYADACQEAGVVVLPWRNETFCPLPCPNNSHYEQCGTSCPATCSNPGFPSICNLPCAEGCVCDKGYVLLDRKCVPDAQCQGCWDGDKHYPLGSEFWTDDTCSVQCSCPSTGSGLECHPASCPADKYCGINNGKPGCYDLTFGNCIIYGDPHYTTFDKEVHHFMGVCTYTLSKLCSNSTSSLPYFNVEAKNEHRGNPTVSYVQKVIVDVYDHRITIVKNEPNRVQVNGVWAILPVNLLNGSLTVTRSGRYVLVETDFKLTVAYDNDYTAEVNVPSTYFNQTCGMCGNLNGDRIDDFMMPNGQQAQNSNQLGDSWKVDDDDPSCTPVPPPPICPPEKEEFYKSDTYCGLITSKDGPFQACHSVINSDRFLSGCVFDLCVLGDAALCTALETYADACQRAGVSITWRNSTFCPLECPANSHYNPCSSACPATCVDQNASNNCSKPCIEDCECNIGFVLSGSTCVSVSDCGCFYNGKYYQKGDTFWQGQCDGQCTCFGNNNVTCNDKQCGPNEICKVQGGVLGCTQADFTICHIHGDPHYITFDGKLYHFQGACTYTTVETCKNSSVDFSVTTRNEHRGSLAWTALNSVAVSIGDLHVILAKNKIVYVNGSQVTLPVNSIPGISIYISGSYVVLQSDIGLEVKFDGDHELFVKVHEKFKDQLCGLCGTYTDNILDDFLMPNGLLAFNSNEFGNSWRIPDDNWVCEDDVVDPPPCNPADEKQYEEQCKIILSGNGPFKECHFYILPQIYFESCVYDQCATGGDLEQLCNALESYAAACENAGVNLGNWKDNTICGNSTTTPTTASTPRSTTTTTIPTSTTPKTITTPSATSTTPKTITTPSATSTTPKTITTPSANSTTPKTITTPSATSTTPKTITTPSATSTTPKTTTTPSATSTTPTTITTTSATSTTPKTITTTSATSTTPKTTTTPPATSTTPKTTTTPPATSTKTSTTTSTTEPEVQCPMTCTFDHDFCHWRQSKQDYMDWISIKGPTPSEGTGPTSDHTGDGFYIYVDGRYSEEGDYARLESPECELVTNHCFNFWYHMYGTAKYMELKVWVVTFEGLENIINIEGDQGDLWHYTEVPLLNNGKIQIFIDGVIGETSLSDVAVDDITIYPGYCRGPPTTSTTRSPSGGTTATPTTFSTTLTTSSTISTITPSTTSPISTTSQNPGSTLTSTLPPSLPYTSTIRSTTTQTPGSPVTTTLPPSTSKTTSTTTQTPGSPVTTTLPPSTSTTTSTTTQTPGSPVTTTLSPSTSTKTSTTTQTPGSPVTTTLPPSTSTTTSTTTQTPGSPVTTTLSPSTSTKTSTTTQTPGSPVTTTLPPSTSTTTSTTTQTPGSPVTTTLSPSTSTKTSTTPQTPGSPVTTTLPPSTSTKTSTTSQTPGSPVTTTLPPSTSTTTSTTTQTPGSPVTTTLSPSTSTKTSTTTQTPGSPVTTTLPPSTSTTTSTTTQTPGSPVTTTLSPSTSTKTSTTPQTPGSPVTTTLPPSTSTTTSTTTQTPDSTLTSTWSPSTSTTTSTTTRTTDSTVTSTLPPSTSTTTSTTTQTQGSTVSSTLPPSAGITEKFTTTPDTSSSSTTLTYPTSTRSTATQHSTITVSPPGAGVTEKSTTTPDTSSSSTTLTYPTSTRPTATQHSTITVSPPGTGINTVSATTLDVTSEDTTTTTLSPTADKTISTLSTATSTSLKPTTTSPSETASLTSGLATSSTTSEFTKKTTLPALESTSGKTIVTTTGPATFSTTLVSTSVSKTQVTTGKTSVGATGFTTITTSKPVPEITTASSTTGVTTSASTLAASPETTSTESTTISESLKSTPGSISKTTAKTSETTSDLTSKAASTTTSSTSGTTSETTIVSTTAASETSTKTGSPIISSSTHITSSGTTTTLSFATDLITETSTATSSGQTSTITPRTTHSATPTPTTTISSEIVTSSRTTHTYPETSGLIEKSTTTPDTSSSTTLTYPTSTRSTTTQHSTITSTISPLGPGSCVVEGDPHYHTFDNQLHHFMGICTYTLSKVCEDDGHLPIFNVEAANENKGNPKVSYVKYVNVDVHEYRITLDKGRQVTVNGKIVVLPTDLPPEVKIFLSGNNVVVTTGFGLKVTFDGNHKVVVTIPGNYANKVCGLCGNFNENKNDDFINPEGELEPNSTSLGNSWQVENDTRCTPATDHTPECTDEDKNTIASNSFCGLITDIIGPFKDCHSVINPLEFFSTCVYDLCELNMDPEILCNSLQSYADICQSQGVAIQPWRNETFCPPTCPSNSHYEQCGTACPATCVNPGSSSSCNLPCAEGCFCDPGYVLYDKKCVPSNQCGCWDGDKYYPVGTEFWSDDTCSSKCTCPSPGSGLVCKSESCPSNQYCGITNGVPGCYFYVFGICRVHNDPHYDTFDRQNHNFMGLCTYTLAKLCSNSSALPYFNVEAKNAHRGDPSVSFVEKVFIEVYDQKVQIWRHEQNRVLVNGIWTTLPVNLVEGLVTVTWTGKYVSLQTDFKLTVSYDTDSSVEVKVPSTYSSLTCGMCGNFNNRKSDEYLMPNGEQAPNSEVLGHSWIVEDDDPLCHPTDPEPTPLPVCPPEKEELYASNEFCGLLTSKDGPFYICNSVISPAGFFESCIFDMCALNGDQDVLCSLLGAYADACQKEGVSLNWRNSTICVPKCPANSHYNVCMSSCPATCLQPHGPENCSSPCLEGCECDDGYVISGGTCVSKSNCGCWYNETYFNEGEKFLQGDCENSCECLGNNNVVCSPVSCAKDEICKVHNGALGCYPPSTAVCHIYGDPHYTTFDGTLHHFQGSCTYTVTETCEDTSNNFTITTRNEHRGNPSWTAINSVALTVNGTHISLQKNNIVFVNNAQVTLPVNLSGINIIQSGRYVIVTTDFGLELQFDGDHELFVRIKENYKGKLCGLCGTYNDDRKDDFMTPDGNVVQDVNDFGNSWRVEDNEWPCDSTPPPPPTCPPSLNEEAEKMCWIIKQTDGPFRPCHSYLRPHLYFESCVFDQCATGGSIEQLCNVLESYAAACKGLGVSLGDWINNTICDPNATTPPSVSSTTHPGPRTTTISISSAPVVSVSSTTTSTSQYTEPPLVSTSPVSSTSHSVDTTAEPGVSKTTTTPSSTAKTTITDPGSSSSVSTTTKTSTTGTTPIPPSSGSCVVQGDPHYQTFDNQLHHFMGTCTYTLSKVCKDDGHLPPFNVEAANEHRGNTKVSYVKYVNVDVHGYRITLDKGRQVMVNGKIEVLPINLSPDIKVFISGNNVLLTTGFGLQVAFDGNHKVVVTIPGNYYNKVCGLCGNFNGNKNDDFLNPEGELEPNSTSLGNSWQVDNDTRCSPGEDHTPECTDEDKNTIASSSFCGLITDNNGPFRDCHNVINPSIYFDTCVYDLCELNMDPGSLCNSLQSYAEVCQSHGVTIHPWRNETFCPLNCPSNSHYDQCGTACPTTCVPGSSSNCNLPCAEGCFCNDGYVLYDKKCVPSNQCGCWDGDKYYSVGTEFWSDDTCSSKCTCPSPGSGLVCKSESCPSNQYCGITNGVPGCYFYVFGICRVHNDPHYDTFDRQNHNFMGLCTYTLAKLCSNSSSLPYFNVEAKNAHRGDPSVSFVEKVFIEVYDQKVQIWRHEQNRVLVNGIWTTLPVNLVEGLVTVTWTGKYVSLQTDFKLTVSYDTDSSVEVKVPSTYSSLTCGMCGNFNNRKSDEYLMPNGEQAPNSEVLGHSWIVEDDDPLCHPTDPEPTPLPLCPPEEQELFESNEFCGLITSKDGPFYICNSVINPAGFFESCIFDMCALDGDQDVLCSLLGAYADACQKEGVSLNWRNSTLCQPKCPANSHYNVCMSSCPATCLQPHGPENCSSPCLEGCECDDGYVISGGTCVSKSNCGCWYNETYFNEGEKFLQGDCENSCECLGNNNVVCSPVLCAKDEICKVQNGTLGCYPPSTAVCHIYGDPHYTTFDGTLHHFQGSCTYTVTETCEDTSNNFTITTRNEHRGNPSWTAINSVALTVNGTHILLEKNNIVFVNNAQVTLPVNLSGINIIQSGRYVIVTTDFGLELQFNGDHELFVRIKENYKGKLCGLCGTYNDDRKDDFMTPDGNVVQDVNDFGNSWRVEDNEWPCDSITPPTPTCPPLLEEEAEKMCWIIKQTDGPFRPCHSYLRPHLYFESCIFDQCITGGSKEQLCNVLESYAAACEALGVSLGDWISKTVCDPNATTPPPVATTTHPGPDVTTPQPHATTTHPGPDVTTPPPHATTTHPGPVVTTPPPHATTTHPGPDVTTPPPHATTTHPAPDVTTPSPVATTTHPAATRATTTPPKLEHGICSASGDPHYNTFDNNVHHYMGNCSYTLSKLCNGSQTDLPYFHVYTTNEHRKSNTKVSYVQSVHVEIYNNTIDLLKNKKLNINGIRRNVPITSDSRYRVYVSGNYLLVETDFGLRVKFDGNHYVDVYLPSDYKGQVCGLCGNYNGSPTDDFTKPDGSLAINSKELGDSWIVSDDTASCGSQDTGSCEPSLEEEYSKNTYCGILTDPTGIFEECHSLVDVGNFFESCKQDMCFTGGESTSLCYAVQAYAQMCSEAGVCIEWRSETFCPISCPGGSHYKNCGSECPKTCYNSSSPTLCKSMSVEGCFCEEGFVLSGDRCVPEADCGCMDSQNNFYELGESWYTHENCTERCTCSKSNNITCAPWECGILQTCINDNGVIGCHSSGKRACHISGDPHFFTFDKVMHNFMGTCTYILVTLCDNRNVVPVTVSGKTEDRGQRAATYLKEVYIDVHDIRITLQKGKRILVDNEQIHSPWVGHVKGISIQTVGLYVVVETDFGMIAKFDGDHHLEIILPDSYYNKVCGMCGNFNDDENDELLMQNGLQANNVTQFGNSWKSIKDSDAKCVDDDRNDLNPQCVAAQKPAIETQCEILLSDTFKACHGIVDQNLFVQSCVYDMCRYNGMVSTLCAIFQAYVDACRSEGVNIKWRSSSLCPLACPTHSHYSECVSLCPPTCNDIYASAVCDKPNKCVEGCVCNDGYVLSDDKCVALKSCGCRDTNDKYYNVDESWITPHCAQKCQCTMGNKIKCKSFSCPHGICSLNSQGKYNCKPSGFTKCTISGDPHYRTFDGLTHHFQGKETYMLVQTSSTMPDYMEPFKIEGKNVPMTKFSTFTLLKELRIEVYNQVILFTENKKLLVNGVRTVPPSQPHDGIKIYQKPSRIYLETDFGLSVSFDGAENGEITVPSTYRDVLQGLCGNYDGINSNDFRLPGGSTVRDVNSFGNSWNVKLLKTRIRREAETSKLNEAEEPLDTGDNLVCSASQLTFVNSTSFCGTLRDTEGPFKNCLQSISPAHFIENCLFDTCAEFRSVDLLCINLEQYAVACLQNGTNIDGWRNTTGCEKTCSSNSQYKDRMSSCPASCSNLASESECEDADTEGCECEEGYVLSGYECVPFKDCGCTYLNNYYPIGEVFLTEGCSQNCTCSEGSYVNCVDNECKDGEVCTTSNQILGCYLPSPCLENPCENGGTCVVEVELNTTVAVCHCPKTYIGEFCENAVDDYNESVIYIVIGVVLGIFAISCLVILVACLYFRSSKKKKGIIDSLDSSEDGRSSYTSTFENQGATGPGNVFDLKYEEAPSIDNADINVNMRTVDNDKAVDNADETSGDLVELVVLDKDTSANNVFDNIYVETLSEGLGGVSNPAFEPDVTDSNFYENVKTEESTNANNSEDTDKENPKEKEDKKQPVVEVETKSEESTGVSNPSFEPDITESNDVKEDANVKNEEVSNANKPEDPKAEMPAVTTDENKLDNDKEEISLNEKSKEVKNAEVAKNDQTCESTQL
ncbi:c-binding -like [Pelobates cultripes]|uniref:C-binding -like n=1 Tax=Pelobates cultripes TaxID=61616 RepID=A0AAD1VPX3_PELCU|nr:c-binding -like [Pelobates cultripes]